MTSAEGCHPTPFSATAPPDSGTASFSRWWYENDGIWAGLAPPYEGRWFAGEPPMKVLWYAEVDGVLEVTGQRLDGPKGSLSAEIPAGYEDLVYQASAILVPEPGCWEVVGSIGNHELRIVAELLPAELNPFGTS